MLTANDGNMEVIEVDKKAKNKKYVNSGHLSAKSVRIEHRPTFSDVSRGVLWFLLDFLYGFYGFY